MSERRYTETEVAEIIERATLAHGTGLRQASTADGMTLTQLQEIGREVGITPEALADAARSLDLADRRTIQRFLGLPVGVGLTADLGRRLSSEEWQRLVVDLRETFEARGRVREEGAFRQWTNGNLQVLVEPTSDGNQVRMRTLNVNARLYVGMGLGLVALAAITFGVRVLTGDRDLAELLGKSLPVGLIGVGLAAFGAFRLPRWARERRGQMESIVARLRSIP